MCGIAGFIGLNEDQRDPVISRMMACLRHRGPDDSGKSLLGDVTFGHQRLSIIDIEHGHQPMTSHDGRYTIIFNGEIYNYLELRQQLIAQGCKLLTFSDTEVLLYAYIKFGKDVVRYLNGMFAFVIHDASNDTLFFARDHFGIKPLYYFQNQDHFVFASEIKALLKHPAVKVRVNDSALFEYLTFQLILDNKTLFQDIHELPAAHYMIVDKGKIKEVKEYWAVQYDIDEQKSAERFADELLVLLENSLSIQLRSDVPVGSHLSGGLDSSTVAVLASKNYYGQLKTFSGGFKDNAIYDETPYARIVSEFINSDHYEIFPSVDDFLDVMDLLVYHMDQPGAGPGIFPQYMVSKLASQHVKVVLGGQGGDEIFGGYARYAVAYLEQCVKGAILETQEEGKHIVTLSSILPNLPMLKQYLPMIKKQFSKGLFDDMESRYFNLIDRSPSLGKIYETNFLSKRSEEAVFSSFHKIFNYPTTPSYFNKMTFFDIKTLLPTLLQIEDRVSMAVSLESRVPLLDYRIMELAAKMPPTMKFAGGKTKHMLLKSVKNVLPKQIIERKDKMGFPVPINDWLAGPLKSYILDVFNSQAAKERGFYKSGAIEKQIKESGKFSREIWGALNVELWHQKFIDN